MQAEDRRRPRPEARSTIHLPIPGRPLEFTGERFTMGTPGDFGLEHIHRYLAALGLCHDRLVLDVASGEGYGTALIADVARGVVGVELDPAVVGHAVRNYGASGALFVPGEASALPLASAAFDVVVSFETLEHIAAQEEFLRETKRVLRPGGVLLISTPDRAVYSPLGSCPNPFHVRELDRTEFLALLRARFGNVALWGQRTVHGSAILAEADPSAGLADWSGFVRRTPEAVERARGLPYATYLLAVASDGPLPPIPAGVLDDPAAARPGLSSPEREEAARYRARPPGPGEPLRPLRDEVQELQDGIAREVCARLRVAADLAEARWRAEEQAGRLARLESEAQGLREARDAAQREAGRSLSAGRAEAERLRAELEAREQRLVQASSAAAELEGRLRAREEELRALGANAAATLAAVHASRSWKATAPLRHATTSARSFIQRLRARATASR
jgi:O-antigen biosynthesis protein